jgi:hypothetical protein
VRLAFLRRARALNDFLDPSQHLPGLLQRANRALACLVVCRPGGVDGNRKVRLVTAKRKRGYIATDPAGQVAVNERLFVARSPTHQVVPVVRMAMQQLSSASQSSIPVLDIDPDNREGSSGPHAIGRG